MSDGSVQPDGLPRWGGTAPRRIMIAVPSLSGQNDIRLTGWLCEMAKAKNAEIFPLGRCSPVAYARNRIVARFMASDCEALWMIDADMAPPPEAWAMTATAGDLVSGMTFAQFQHPVTRAWGICLHGFRVTDEKYLSSLIPNDAAGPHPVDACGTGCLIINRRVFEDERMRLPDVPEDLPVRQMQHREPRDIPAYFRPRRASNDRVLLGEDLDFTFRASRLGYSIAYDTRYVFDHRKEVSLKDCMEMAVAYAETA